MELSVIDRIKKRKIRKGSHLKERNWSTWPNPFEVVRTREEGGRKEKGYVGKKWEVEDTEKETFK